MDTASPALRYVAHRLVQMKLQGYEFDLPPIPTWETDEERDPSDPSAMETIVTSDVGVWVLVRFLHEGERFAWGARFFKRPATPDKAGSSSRVPPTGKDEG